MKKRQYDSDRATALYLALVPLLMSGLIASLGAICTTPPSNEISARRLQPHAPVEACPFVKLSLTPTHPVYKTSLSLADRIAYQWAIEDVYWRHRSWPKEQPGPKPSLDEVMPAARIKQKVDDYVRNSQVADDDWQQPITADRLQAEMERMARHTRQPEVLRELFSALGDDPLVIAECLARPVLVERLVAEFHGRDQQFRDRAKLATLGWSDEAPQLWRTAAVDTLGLGAIAPSVSAYALPEIVGDGPACTGDVWVATNAGTAPVARQDHTAVWTGSEMIVWGGQDSVAFSSTGGKYVPATDSWTATNTTNAPLNRTYHTAVWTGTEMIVWGGYNNVSGDLNTGGKYNPSANTWIATSTTNAPSARQFPKAVWTGSEMVVWGGGNGSSQFGTGARYNPIADTWVATGSTNAPSARFSHTVIWTGSEMIVWGGYNNSLGALNTGAKYNPGADSWTATNNTTNPVGRTDHTAVWTGSEMIIWGGSVGGSSQGWRYNPVLDSWTPASTTNVPLGRYNHTAVWTGSEMIVWGGLFGTSPLDTGGRYNPVGNSWATTSMTNAPSGRYNHTAVWTGSEMIVWGGYNNSSPLNTGGKYCAQLAATPTPTSTPTASPTPTPPVTPTPSPTPTPALSISGTISYCSNPIPGPVPNVTLTLTGDRTTSTITDGSGNYTFLSLVAGGNYTVTPTKTALPSGSAGIDTVDVAATRRHYVQIVLLTGCQLTAGDVNGDTVVDTTDVVAIQRFYLGQITGIANVGKYQFNPVNRTYPGVVSNQTAQNYDTLVFGDVAAGFVERPADPSQTTAADGMRASTLSGSIRGPESHRDRFVVQAADLFTQTGESCFR